MIKEFKDNPTRDFGNVYQSMLSQIKKRYEKDPEQAGELAISFIEFVLTGEISSVMMISLKVLLKDIE